MKKERKPVAVVEEAPYEGPTIFDKVFKTKKRDRSSMEGKDAEGEGDWKRLKDKTEAKIRKEREKLERCERRIRKLQSGAGEARKVEGYAGESRRSDPYEGETRRDDPYAGEERNMDQYGEEGRRMDRERGSVERARASEKMRLSEERMRLSEERMRLSEERSMRSEERNSRSEEKSRRRHRESHSSRSSRGDDDRLPRAYQANKSYDSSDNEGSPSPPPLNASSEGCETNVDPY